MPLGTIRPKGWLHQQASLQADALTSHLPLFWPEIANTSWLGGPSDNDGGIHESTPYWLNGALPLAVQLGNIKLSKIVEHYILHILDRQTDDGWLGPDTNTGDFWSRYPFVLALCQFHEIQPVGSRLRKRALQAALDFFKAVKSRIDGGAQFEQWSAARSHDLIWAVHYFIDASDAGEENEFDSHTTAMLLNLATLVHQKGFDWHAGWFGNASAFPTKAATQYNMWTHGVNNAQAIKHGAVWSRQSAEPNVSTLQSWNAWQILMQYHGQPSGSFSADEHLAGSMPSRGVELCVVVESMWSLQILAQASPSDSVATKALDALEGLAVNALPGGVSDDLWSHPYLQFANSIQARPNVTDHIWPPNDSPDSGMYGLSPNYECCTSNLHQGYPKLIASLFYEIPNANTLISTAWLPSALTTPKTVGGGAEIEVRTRYPFGTSVEYVVKNPEPFMLKLHVPKFLREIAGPTQGLATLRVWVEGHERTVELVDGFLAFEIPAWPLPEPRCAIRLVWSAPLRVQRSPPGREQGSSLFVGPILMVPNLGEQWTLVRRYKFEAADWDISGLSYWRYALPHMKDGAVASMQVQWKEIGIRPYAHSPAACPVTATVELVHLQTEMWPLLHGSPGPIPPAHLLHGTRDNVTLMPYGCTAIRIAALPDILLDATMYV